MNFIRKGFLSGISYVHPQNLLTKFLVLNNNEIIVGKKSYPAKSCYVVGFGKAVGGMVPVLERTLNTSNNSLIKQGIVSVPCGYLNSPHSKFITNDIANIKAYEGAQSNLPDNASQDTTERILELVKSLSEDDLLIVLISGGGSALLTLPIPPLTLEEKRNIIKTLSLKGASITEINTVRKAISAVKGGKLAKNTKAQIVSFILSDIIDSPLDMIASGPTIYNKDSFKAPYEVLKKYNIPLSDNLQKALENSEKEESKHDFDKVYNILIGDNKAALNAIKSYFSNSPDIKCCPVIMSTSLEGEASVIGKEMAKLAFALLTLISDNRLDVNLNSFSKSLKLSPSAISSLNDLITRLETPLCLLFGGETTVKVRGNGAGGRNQEMVLSASLELEQLSKTSKLSGEIAFLSGGTDGIDGPTDAAGALTYYSKQDGNIRLQTTEARQQGLSPDHFLSNNDSYNYFSKLSNGEYLLKTGHTGTNVMDIQLLYISKI